MSLNLPDQISLPTSPGRHNTAIAEVVLWSIIWIIGVTVRLIQERRYWNHRKQSNVARWIFYSWLRNFVVLLAQIRIIGFSMYLANSSADKGLVITEVVLQGVGISPLTLELSLVLLKCGHVGLKDRKASHYSSLVRTLLVWTRLPILIAITLICVAGGIVNTDLIKAGAVVLLVTFIYLVLIIIFLFISGQFMNLPKEGQQGVLVLVAALPFYIVRMVYMMLSDFGGIKYSPAIGDWRMAVGLEFVMEIAIVLLLVGTSLVVEPIFGRRSQESDDTVEATTCLAKEGSHA